MKSNPVPASSAHVMRRSAHPIALAAVLSLSGIALGTRATFAALRVPPIAA